MKFKFILISIFFMLSTILLGFSSSLISTIESSTAISNYIDLYQKNNKCTVSIIFESDRKSVYDYKGAGYESIQFGANYKNKTFFVFPNNDANNYSVKLDEHQFQTSFLTINHYQNHNIDSYGIKPIYGKIDRVPTNTNECYIPLSFANNISKTSKIDIKDLIGKTLFLNDHHLTIAAICDEQSTTLYKELFGNVIFVVYEFATSFLNYNASLFCVFGEGSTTIKYYLSVYRQINNSEKIKEFFLSNKNGVSNKFTEDDFKNSLYFENQSFLGHFLFVASLLFYMLCVVAVFVFRYDICSINSHVSVIVLLFGIILLLSTLLFSFANVMIFNFVFVFSNKISVLLFTIYSLVLFFELSFILSSNSKRINMISTIEI